MNIAYEYNWNPAKELLKVAKETIANNHEDEKGKNAIAILAMAAVLEAKAKEPFIEMMPDRFNYISGLDFQQLLYALWMIEVKGDFTRGLKFEKYNRNTCKDTEFNNYKVSIKKLMSLRNQIAHGKIVKAQSNSGPSMGKINVSTEDLNINDEFKDLRVYLNKIPKDKQITRDPAVIFDYSSGNLFFRKFIAQHFLTEVDIFIDFIHKNKAKWIEGYRIYIDSQV